jgi:hypothetical protein
MNKNNQILRSQMTAIRSQENRFHLREAFGDAKGTSHSALACGGTPLKSGADVPALSYPLLSPFYNRLFRINY